MPEEVIPIAGSIIGGLSSGDSSGPTGTSTVVQKADPWEGVQPALRTLYDAALQNFSGQGPQYYPSSTVAPQSPVTQQAQEGTYALATAESPVLRQGQQMAYNTFGNEYLYANPAMQDLYDFAGRDYLASSPAMWNLYGVGSGMMLNQNPYIDEMFNQAAGSVGRQFSKNVQPGIASMFEGAGRFGSNQMAEGLGQAQEEYGNVLNDLAVRMYGGNYATERGYQQQALGQLGQFGLQGQALQQQAAGQVGDIFSRERALQAGMLPMAPALDQADYYGVDRLSNLGMQQDQYNQRVIDADIARYNFGQNQPNNELLFLKSLLSDFPVGQTTTTTAQGPSQQGNPITGLLGGYNLGKSVFDSIGGGYNPLGWAANWGNTASDEALNLFF